MGIVWALGGLLILVLGYAFLVEPWRLTVERVEVELRGLPPALDGLRLVHLTDLHVGQTRLRLRQAERAVQLTAALRPDFVVLTGDLVTMHDWAKRVLPILGRLRATHGVWAALGNHDYSWTWWLNLTGRSRRAYSTDQWRQLLDEVGVRLLENESARVAVNGAELWLGGCGDPYCHRDDLPATLVGVPSGAPLVLLCHSPDVLDRGPVSRAGLVLCGHSHGGQVRLPGLGPIWAPCRKWWRRASGLSRENGTWLYANRGVSAGSLFRIRCQPEVALVTLRAERSQADGRGRHG